MFCDHDKDQSEAVSETVDERLFFLFVSLMMVMMMIRVFLEHNIKIHQPKNTHSVARIAARKKDNQDKFDTDFFRSTIGSTYYHTEKIIVRAVVPGTGTCFLAPPE